LGLEQGDDRRRRRRTTDDGERSIQSIQRAMRRGG
jgi:hypothetical protein